MAQKQLSKLCCVAVAMLAALGSWAVMSGCTLEDNASDGGGGGAAHLEAFLPNDEFGLTLAEDLDPSPDVIRLEFEARVQEVELRTGKTTPAWTYNGVVPAPLIKAKVGDRLIVNFTNHLPEPSSIHWHGLRVPNSMDGVPM